MNTLLAYYDSLPLAEQAALLLALLWWAWWLLFEAPEDGD
jgi:hypothetical protein